MRKPLFCVIALGFFGTACATTGAETAAKPRFDKRLYERAQQPELAALDPALGKCNEDGPLTIAWQVAGDGHIEDVKIVEPAGYSDKVDACVRAQAYKAQFTAPANHKQQIVSREVGTTVVAGEL